MKSLQFASVLLAALLLPFAAPVTGNAQAQNYAQFSTGDEANNIEVFKRTSPSVVNITNARRVRSFYSLNPQDVPQGSGTGFVWDDEGHIVTNFHVVQQADRVLVTLQDGMTYDAIPVGVAPNHDLAVLKIDVEEIDLVPIVPGDSSLLEVGRKVVAIGNPFGLDTTMTVGVVSALGREIDSVTRRKIRDVIQTDAAINPGNSGGPLFNSSGELVGINTMIITDGGGKGSVGIGFAIDGDYAQKTVNQLYSGKKIERPYMGIMFRPVKKEDMKNYVYGYGAYVEEIVPDSPAAGILKVGDIILYMDNERVKWRLLATRVKSKTIGEEAHFIIIRDGMEVPLTFVMGAMQE